MRLSGVRQVQAGNFVFGAQADAALIRVEDGPVVVEIVATSRLGSAAVAVFGNCTHTRVETLGVRLLAIVLPRIELFPHVLVLSLFISRELALVCDTIAQCDAVHWCGSIVGIIPCLIFVGMRTPIDAMCPTF